MSKSLVIVESPAKAKTINKYLGRNYTVKSSVGHIRDLPKSGGGQKADPKAAAKKAAETRKLSPAQKAARKKREEHKKLVNRMGIDPKRGWVANYEVLSDKEKVVDELKKLASNADTVYLATDRDREGEAIAWHLREVIGGDEDRFRRVTFNEITKSAIEAAFDDPGRLDMHRVEAQQARRFLDRVVGYMGSPLLWAKIGRGLSAGRVQSVAVRLIVEREGEIRAFVPVEFWQIGADLAAKNTTTRFDLTRLNGDKWSAGNEAAAMAAVDALRAARYAVTAREDRPTSGRPGAPFITSTLQQAASTRMSFGVRRTMTLAQRLYEAGHITYMRTDSTNLSAEAVSACRDYIGNRYGPAYLPESPRTYSSKDGAQEAHEAIRPTDVNVLHTALADMEADARRLYELIWQQFVACQMPNSRFKSTTLTVTGANGSDAYELVARGRVIEFDGYLRVAPVAKNEDMVLPDLAKGDSLSLEDIEATQHFTKPKPRYTEASLVKELEKRGIGRPSTYASIISTIQDRGYVRVENRRFHAEKIGEITTARLAESFADLMDYSFTARMEEKLDDVSDGELAWLDVLDEFYDDFTAKLEAAYDPETGMRANSAVEIDMPCSKCGRPMQIRTASTGVFLGCSGYNLPPKERCKNTVNLVPGDEAIDADDEEAETNALRAKRRCPKCGTAMDSWLVDAGHKLHVCGNNPDCDGVEIERGEFRIKGYEGPSLECDKCGAEMQLKTGRFGKFFGCTGEVDGAPCKNTRKLLKNGQPAPPKMDPVPMPELRCEKVDDHFLLRDGASGLFLAASQFPKYRETRAPLVRELVPHREEIDSKWHFIVDGPQKDNEGRPTQVRYSRKQAASYLMTEGKDGKPSGWSAWYEGGEWRPEIKAPRPGARKKASKKKTPRRAA